MKNRRLKKQGISKKIIFLFLILLIQNVFALNIVREFSNNNINVGEEITVNLAVSISEGDEVYVIEENIPEGIVVVDNGDGSYVSDKKKMLWVVMNPQQLNHNYKVKATTSGEKVFSGVYSLNGQDEVIIGEDNILSVRASSGSSDGSSSGSTSTTTQEDSSSDLNQDIENLNTLSDQEEKIKKEIGDIALVKEEKKKSLRIVYWVTGILAVLILVVVVLIVRWMKKR